MENESVFVVSKEIIHMPRGQVTICVLHLSDGKSIASEPSAGEVEAEASAMAKLNSEESK